MIGWIVAVFMVLGSLFMLLAAIGVARMPDLFMRMQAATKAATMGAGLIGLAVALHFGDIATVMRAGLVIGFIFITAPVSAHLIGRAAYFVGVPLWEGTVIDELRGHYDLDTHVLASETDSIAPSSSIGDSPNGV